MAKSDLLKEAIADAKAVKETALANAKIALQEAFAPRLERMLATRLTNEIEGEEDADAMGDETAVANANAADAAETGAMGNDVGDLSIDVDGNGEFDEFDIYSKTAGGEEEVAGEEEAPASEEEMSAEYNEDYSGHSGSHGDELNLDEIIRELEGDLEDEDEMMMPEAYGEDEDEDEMMMPEAYEEDESEESIDEIIEAILREDDVMIDDIVADDDEDEDITMEEAMAEKEEELQEAYRTVKQLQGILSEVNLLNAKLLYTNKLFRNFELSENQKMKVIENFDRAGNTREVKLVFTTLAESFNRPAKKRVVKESYASRATTTTAPSKQTTQVLSEGFELANRWKKLAGLL